MNNFSNILTVGRIKERGGGEKIKNVLWHHYFIFNTHYSVILFKFSGLVTDKKMNKIMDANIIRVCML